MHATGAGPARTCSAALALLALLACAAPTSAQDEIDRQVDPGEGRADPAPPRGAQVPPPGSAVEPPPGPPRPGSSGLPVPDQGRGEGPFIPEEFDPSLLPPSEPPAPAEPSLWEQTKLKHEGRVRAGAGHDSNVFRADRDRTADTYAHGQIELELLATLPQGLECFASFAGETMAYLAREKANEHFASTFLEAFQPLTPWLDVGAQNALEYSRQNLLDDNGDLFPRGRFGSIDEEVRLYAIVRPEEDITLEAGVAGRWKDYDENRGVESLDYEEVRFDASIGWKIARDPRTRVKLKYRFRRRDYREFRARARDGTSLPLDGSLGEPEPHLDLHRHQVTLNVFQDLRVRGQDLRIVLGLGLAYNRDLYEGDRSYREASASLKVEWWPIPEMTRLDLSVRTVARDFTVRHPPGSGGRLHHRLVDVTIGASQRLRRDIPVFVYAQATITEWRSGDPLEGYQRVLAEGGVEVKW